MAAIFGTAEGNISESLGQINISSSISDAGLNRSSILNIDFISATMTSHTPAVCHLFRLVVLGALVPLIGLFGLVGNSLAMLTLWPSKNTVSISHILVCLAACDSGIIFVWWLNLGLPAVCNYVQSNLCLIYLKLVFPCLYVYLWPLGRWCHIMGTWLVVLVTFHRYVAVCHPLKANTLTNIRMARRCMVAIAIVSFVYITPRFFSQYLEWDVRTSRYVRRDTRLGASQFWFSTVYETISYVIIIFAIPFPVISYMTICLIRSLQRIKGKRQAMTRKRREEKDLTKTLVVVIVIFLLCQLPNPIRRLSVALFPDDERLCDSFYPYYRCMAALFVVINASVNFAVYCFCGERFRYSLVRRLKAIFRCGNKVQDLGSSENTFVRRSTMEENRNTP